MQLVCLLGVTSLLQGTRAGVLGSDSLAARPRRGRGGALGRLGVEGRVR